MDFLHTLSQKATLAYNSIIHKLDASGSAYSISISHAKIHEGNSYIIQEGITLNNASKEYLITTPDTSSRAHLTFEILGSLDTSFSLTEGSEKTGGTEMTPYNRNRNSDNESVLTFTHTPSGSEGSSTELLSAKFGNASGVLGSGGIGQNRTSRHELILQPNESYLLTVTALSANDNNITVTFDWYEV